ncbi:RNA polymerase sigma factor SigX [Bacillus kwashiorkori]|uniref:RNA polymerase sigma factor SigX n=1 Tax=Bacillus kwashiorkori TaxID=1522318 RepID=UPI0007844AFB|nr:RNA polymerase sigma factor SigX [Bacillus kwashiorkori]
MNSVFDEIYDQYHHDIFQFLFYLVKNREQAEDLSQEVYIRVIKSYNRFEGKSSVKTWILSIARNVAIDHFRKEKNWKDRVFSHFNWVDFEIKDQRPIPEEIALKNEKVQLLYHCLDLCTVDQKLVLITRFIQDLSITETAEVLGWSESKVKTTQHRALKNLKKVMEDKLKEGGTAIDDNEK